MSWLDSPAATYAGTWVLLTGRGAAQLIIGTAIGLVTVGAGLTTATLLVEGSGPGPGGRLVGAVAYLALIGLLVLLGRVVVASAAATGSFCGATLETRRRTNGNRRWRCGCAAVRRHPELFDVT